MKLLSIGRKLYNLRKYCGLSRKTIEQKFGISANTIKVWESGNTEIGIIRLRNYLKIFEDYGVNVDLSDFLENKNPDIDDSVSAQINLIADTIKQTIKNAIMDSEHMFNALFNSLSLNIIIKDAEHKILRINTSAATLLGGLPKDFENKICYDFFQNQDLLKSNLRCIKDNVIVENIIYNKDRKLEIKNIPVVNPQMNKSLIISIIQ